MDFFISSLDMMSYSAIHARQPFNFTFFYYVLRTVLIMKYGYQGYHVQTLSGKKLKLCFQSKKINR